MFPSFVSLSSLIETRYLEETPRGALISRFLQTFAQHIIAGDFSRRPVTSHPLRAVSQRESAWRKTAGLWGIFCIILSAASNASLWVYISRAHHMYTEAGAVPTFAISFVLRLLVILFYAHSDDPKGETKNV